MRKHFCETESMRDRRGGCRLQSHSRRRPLRVSCASTTASNNSMSSLPRSSGFWFWTRLLAGDEEESDSQDQVGGDELNPFKPDGLPVIYDHLQCEYRERDAGNLQW
jgi:hypothetical protein